eukprot:scaffold153756_cov35-Prasinocladus_malaysianus.AAC.1
MSHPTLSFSKVLAEPSVKAVTEICGYFHEGAEQNGIVYVVGDPASGAKSLTACCSFVYGLSVTYPMGCSSLQRLTFKEQCAGYIMNFSAIYEVGETLGGVGYMAALTFCHAPFVYINNRTYPEEQYVGYLTGRCFGVATSGKAKVAAAVAESLQNTMHWDRVYTVDMRSAGTSGEAADLLAAGIHAAPYGMASAGTREAARARLAAW